LIYLSSRIDGDADPDAMKNLRPVVGAGAFIVAVAIFGYLAVGFAGALFSVALIGGFILWLLTTHRTPIEPQVVIVQYLMRVIERQRFLLFARHVTAIMPIASGWLTFRIVVREMRNQRIQNGPRTSS
jgi:hypothetical protein